MSIFLSILAFLSVSLSHADDCGSVNLITEENSPFQNIPVVDQKKSNICYALAAAQLGDYYLIKRGAKKRELHPVWLALNYALLKGRRSMDIGHVKDTLEQIQEVKNCPFEQVSELIHEDDFFLAPVDVLSSRLGANCSARIEVRFPPIRRFSYNELPNDTSIEKFLISRIGKQNSLPLSIAYCSKVLKYPEYHGVEINSEGVRDVIKKDCEYHESLIVGRKNINSTCHLLLRNSWGDTWKSGNKKWACLCRDRLSGRFDDNCTTLTHPHERFSVEACWIPSSVLSKNVGAITFLDEH